MSTRKLPFAIRTHMHANIQVHHWANEESWASHLVLYQFQFRSQSSHSMPWTNKEARCFNRIEVKPVEAKARKELGSDLGIRSEGSKGNHNLWNKFRSLLEHVSQQDETPNHPNWHFCPFFANCFCGLTRWPSNHPKSRIHRKAFVTYIIYNITLQHTYCADIHISLQSYACKQEI